RLRTATGRRSGGRRVEPGALWPVRLRSRAAASFLPGPALAADLWRQDVLGRRLSRPGLVLHPGGRLGPGRAPTDLGGAARRQSAAIDLGGRRGPRRRLPSLDRASAGQRCGPYLRWERGADVL